MRSLGWFGSLAVWLASALPAGANEPAGITFFEQKIRPVLVKECYDCHSAGAKKLRGGLRLDSRQGMLDGGDSGPAVVPGKPDESPLLDALRHDGIAMPPKRKLPETVVADFERWIGMGAPDPRAGNGAPPRATKIDIEEGREFWSYQQPRRHEPPPDVARSSWPLTEIDAFVLARQRACGIRPVADADKATLARRLAFDLTGLPPSPDAIDDFVNDTGTDAYERLVDRLIASPHFGERWGRHWLDVVRFGESLTLRGFVLKEAWRYRDYVVAAVNADMPFNRFLKEQIAGDLLPAASLDDRRRKLIALTFLAMGNTNLEEQDKRQLEMDVVDEQLDTIGKAFLAQTIGCARCHDHKFDPIPTRDYYALAGILRNTRSLEHANVSKWLERPLPAPPEVEKALAAREQAIGRLEARIKSERALANASGTTGGRGVLAARDLPGIVVEKNGQGYVLIANEGTKGHVVADALLFIPVNRLSDRSILPGSPSSKPAKKGTGALAALEAELNRLRASGPRRAMVMTVEEAGKIDETRVHIRGSVHNLGEPTPRGFLRVASFGTVPPFPSRESGRRELAEWIASDDNPLTARVIVNRAWHWLFGAGLVRTTDNFGTTGERPSHPELLDELAVRFRADGWSFKSLVRRIVLSRTYRLASADDPHARAVDPENRLLWRANRRRLDAECLGDAILRVSGRLRQEMGGPSFPADIAADYGFKSDDTRRKLYVPVFRNALPELFEVFDFADPSMVVGRRDVSTVTPQALFMMNHPFVLNEARHAAHRLLAECEEDDATRIVRAYRRALGRAPTHTERRIGMAFVARVREESDRQPLEESWASLFQALFASADFRYID